MDYEKRKHDPTMNSLQEINFRFKGTHKLKVKGWKEICQVNSNKKRPEMTVVISQSIEFKMEILAKKKRENIKIIKRLIHQEDLKLIIINTYMFV